MLPNHLSAPEQEIKEGMMIANALSLPFRGLNTVINGFIHLLGSTHPVAKAALNEISQSIHKTWSQSSLGQNWAASRIKIIEGFERDLEISQGETAYFLDSVEELMLAGGTAGIASMAKASLKAAKQFASHVVAKNTGYPLIDSVYFDPTTATKTRKYKLVPGTPAEGFIECYHVRGSQNSILIYLDYIQKGKVYNWHVESTLSYPAYSTSKAGLIAIKEIAQKAGAEKVFLQFHPVNPKFHDFVAKHYPFKGSHYIWDKQWQELEGLFPVFELSAAVQGVGRQILNISMPFTISQTLKVLWHDGQVDHENLYSYFAESSKTQKLQFSPSYDNLSHATENSLPVEKNLLKNQVEENLLKSQTDLTLNEIGNYLTDLVQEASLINPARSELKELHGIMIALAKNSEQGLIAVVSKVLKVPETAVKNVLDGSKNFSDQIDFFSKNQSITGALAVCGTLLTFMSSVTWSINFLKDPKTMTVETIKLPYTTVKGVVELGIGLLRNPEKTVVTFAKSLIQAPGRVVNSFLRSIGLKKKKKKRAPLLSISTQEQKKLIDQYLADLTTLYGNAKISWFIDPFKTIEEYHHDLFLDWQSQADLGSINFFDFPSFLNAKFDQGDLKSIKRWSKKAHPNETIAPIEVSLAYLQIANSMENVQVTSQALNAAHQIDLEANQKLNEERAILAQNVSKIKSLLDNNEEKMKNALLARMNARGNR